MQHQALRHLEVVFKKIGLRVTGNEGRKLEDLAMGPYIRVNNDRRKTMWRSRQEIVRWLERYYSDNKPKSFGARLILKRLGRFGSFLLVNQDADILDLLDRAQRTKMLQIHWSEFEQFAKYLDQQRIFPKRH